MHKTVNFQNQHESALSAELFLLALSLRQGLGPAGHIYWLRGFCPILLVQVVVIFMSADSFFLFPPLFPD